MSLQFKYPVTDFGEALHVLNPNTEPEIFDSNLYVNLDNVRGKKYLNHIYTQLGVKNGQLFNKNNAFAKILLTGHRGSGKSVELQRMIHNLKSIYLPVYINIEVQLVKLSAVEPEDIYQLLVIELMQTLADNNIPFSEKNFRRITNLWMDEQSKETKNLTSYNTSIGSEAGAGINAYIFKLRTFLKSVITAQSEDTDIIGRKIKANISDIIQNLNVELASLQFELKEKGYNGFLFVVDGTEKLDYELAKKVFIKDAPIFNQINSCFIFASPVLGLYDIHAGQAYFNHQILPMVKLNDGNIAAFKSIVTKRIDENTFFEPGMLDCIAKKSGGSIRLLLELSYNALLNSSFNLVNRNTLKDTLYDMGLFLYQRLDKEHKEILRSSQADFDFGNEKVKEMLFSLVLLVQNGSAVINPLVQPFIEGTQNYLCD